MLPLYTIENLQVGDDSLTAMVKLNAAHAIFNGHFPNQPVLPGACMLDIVKDVASVALGEELRLIKADNLKFITPVDPTIASELHVNISYSGAAEGLKFKTVITAGGACMKMDGLFGVVITPYQPA